MKLHNCFQKTKVFNGCIHDFNQRPAAEKTFANFKTAMTEAWTECTDQVELSTANAGYHMANQIAEMDRVLHKVTTSAAATNATIEAMANPVCLDRENRNQVQALTNLPCQLVNQLAMGQALTT